MGSRVPGDRRLCASEGDYSTSVVSHKSKQTLGKGGLVTHPG